MKAATLDRRQQTGASLVITLIVLIVLMILGVGAVMKAGNQFKMSGNLQFENQAKNQAENQLVTAENWLGINGGANTALVPGAKTKVASGKDFYEIALLGLDKRPIGMSSGVGTQGGAGAVGVNLFSVTGHGESARGASRDVVVIYQVLR